MITPYSHANLDGCQLQVYLPSLCTSVYGDSVSPPQVDEHIWEQGEAQRLPKTGWKRHKYIVTLDKSFLLQFVAKLVAA